VRTGVKVTVLSPKQVVFEGDAKSVFMPGDRAEFEILDHHAPIVSLLRRGEIAIDWGMRIQVKRGVMKFDRNECLVLIEE
jgi:F-type H+-transporting ATPase subunit epsilon